MYCVGLPATAGRNKHDLQQFIRRHGRAFLKRRANGKVGSIIFAQAAPFDKRPDRRALPKNSAAGNPTLTGAARTLGGFLALDRLCVPLQLLHFRLTGRTQGLQERLYLLMPFFGVRDDQRQHAGARNEWMSPTVPPATRQVSGRTAVVITSTSESKSG